MRDHGRGRRHRRGGVRAVRRGGRDRRRRRPAGGRAGRPRAGGRRRRRGRRSTAMYAEVREAYGRIDVLFNNAGISPTDDGSVARHRARRLGARAGGQPALGVPVLQARHPAPAGRRRRLGHQHRELRRRDGRGDVADRLHRLQGRRARAQPRARRAVRQAEHPRQRAVPGPGRHAAAARALRQGPRAGPAPARPRADGPLRARRARSRTPRCFSPATTRRTSTPRRSSSTAG